MRTTLEIDDDLIAPAKEVARQQGKTLGQLVSDFTRKSLAATDQPIFRNGARIFRHRPGAPKVDMEFVNMLRDEE
jgi:hypothetical protein